MGFFDRTGYFAIIPPNYVTHAVFFLTFVIVMLNM